MLNKKNILLHPAVCDSIMNKKLIGNTIHFNVRHKQIYKRLSAVRPISLKIFHRNSHSGEMFCLHLLSYSKTNYKSNLKYKQNIVIDIVTRLGGVIFHFQNTCMK